MSPRPGGPSASRRGGAADRRREREARIIAATRRLFDARGVREAQIEDVAAEVGVNRAIIYRHFTGKEELFALVEADYLEELRGALAGADDRTAGAEDRLRAVTEAFVDYGLAHPAFVDCGVTLLRMGPSLLDELSSSALFRLGRGVSDCLARVVDVLEAGVAEGVFDVDDAPAVANTMYSLGLGGLQLARLGVMVRPDTPGVPLVTAIDLPAVRRHLVAASLALVRAPA